MKEIKLNRGKKRIHDKLNISAFVDDEDFERTNQYYWQVKLHGKTRYAKRRIVVDGKQTSETMHRFILGLYDKNVSIDHKDHNGLNNQKSNLRICEHAKNTRNRKKYPVSTKNSSKYKGVVARKNKKGIRYISRITINERVIIVGNFDSEVEAAIAYNVASIKYHEDFGLLNDIYGDELLALIKKKQHELQELQKWLPQNIQNS